MAPLVPRMHVFEIDDQPWFPPWFRRRVQAALTRAWVTKVPILQSAAPAEIVADVLRREVLEEEGAAGGDGRAGRPWIIIDFCAGGGGPTPRIETIINGAKTTSPLPQPPTRFVLTDLHPHVDDWAVAAAASENVRYAPDPVDASAADPAAILAVAGFDEAKGTNDLKGTNGMNGVNNSTGTAAGAAGGVDPSPPPPPPPPKVFRLFNLAFHHFDDPLAGAILKNTVETSDGFGIFELQDRSFGAFLTTLVFGLGILVMAPYYAWIWRSPLTLVFTYLIPVLPFVLVFDGWMSMLRTRTPDEVEALLRTCGAADGAEENGKWELRSGETRHLWPVGYVKWIVCVKKEEKTIE